MQLMKVYKCVLDIINILLYTCIKKIDIINATVGGAKILQLNEVNHSNGGEYTCLIFNDAGIGLSSSQLYILPAFTVQPEDKEVNFTDQAILLCNAESFPYFTIQWQKLDNEIFEDIPGENDSMLVFENAFLSDSNVYRCAVSNVINGTTHTIQSRNATLKGNKLIFCIINHVDFKIHLL